MPSKTPPIFHHRLGLVLAVAGLILLALSLGQYGFMFWRQHQLRQAWHAQLASPPVHSAAADSAPRLLKLVIPRIELDDVVVNGTGYTSLLEGPGWMRSSAPPGRGNTVIAGHRDTFFRGVHKLRPGDILRLEQGQRSFRYQVVTRRIVRPSDTAWLAPTPQPALTLVTCYPTYWIGPAPKRLIVQARLLSK